MRRCKKTNPAALLAAEDNSSPGNGIVDDPPPDWLDRGKLDTTLPQLTRIIQ